MFDQVEEKSGGFGWAVLGGIAAFAALLAAGYFLVQ